MADVWLSLWKQMVTMDFILLFFSPPSPVHLPYLVRAFIGNSLTTVFQLEEASDGLRTNPEDFKFAYFQEEARYFKA